MSGCSTAAVAAVTSVERTESFIVTVNLDQEATRAGKVESSCYLLWRVKIWAEVRKKSVEREDGEQEKTGKSRAFIARK